ncbi:uncharacterized protein NPIL_326831 [Nephila pilipes]|uniref:Spider venom protein n=1 Tax=Nephila pilipes TaxID=299642 RepID=A0A8X6NSD8_NEPPI|nr:uncharacterized protein NPIL_326831 [Nephila pilipes]
MRVMLVVFCVVSVLVSAGYANPLNRQKRFAPFSGAFAGGFPFGGGAFAGTGMSPFPFPSFPSFWDFPKPRYIPFPVFSYPMFPIGQEWYQGDNVCRETKTANAKTPDEFSDWMKDDEMTNVNTQLNHEQESCKGTNTIYECIKKIYDSTGEVKLQKTKYECCHGFIRNPQGPGCIENPNQTNTGTQQNVQRTVGSEKIPNSNDKNYYTFVPSSSTSQSSSSSSTSYSGSLDKVPLQ